MDLDQLDGLSFIGDNELPDARGTAAAEDAAAAASGGEVLEAAEKELLHLPDGGDSGGGVRIAGPPQLAVTLANSRREGMEPSSLPALLEEAQRGLCRWEGTGKKGKKWEAMASRQVSYYLFRLGRRKEALEQIDHAMKVFEELEAPHDYDAAAEHAQAARLYVKIQLAEDNIEEALQKVEHLQETFQASGRCKAEAILLLSKVDLELACERYTAAKNTAHKALNIFLAMNQEDWEAKALQSLARAHLKSENANGSKLALEYQLQAMSRLQKLGSFEDLSGLLLAMSGVLLEKQDYEGALNCAVQSLDFAEEVEDETGRVSAIEGVARVLLVTQSYLPLASQMAQEAVSRFKLMGDSIREIGARQLLAELELANNRHHDAVLQLQTALGIARGLRDYTQVGAVLQVLVSVLAEDGQMDKAQQELWNEVDSAVAQSDLRREIAGLQHLASLQMEPELNNRTLALKCLARAEQKASGDPPLLAYVLRHEAEVHQASGQLGKAIECAAAARKHLQGLGHIIATVEVLQLLANLNMAYGRTEDAVEALKAQITFYEEKLWLDKKAQALLGLAYCKASLSDQQEAAKLAREAKHICEDLKDEDGEAQALLAVAHCLGDTKVALSTALAAQQSFKRIDDTLGEAQAVQIPANIFQRANNTEKAAQKIEEALKLCKEAGNVAAVADVLHQKATLYLKKIMQMRENRETIPESLVTETLDALMDLVPALTDMGELKNRVRVLNSISGVHGLRTGVQAATAQVTAAEDALDLALQLGTDAEEEVGQSFHMLAIACLTADEPASAKRYAIMACGIFMRLEKRDNFGAAKQILEDAEDAVRQANEPLPEPPHKMGQHQSELTSESHAKLRKPVQPEPTVQQSGLPDFLRLVYPDSSENEVQSVQKKLAAIEIHSEEDLRLKWQSYGPQELNKKITRQGKKACRADTLQTLSDYLQDH